MGVLKVKMIKTPESTSIESFGYEEHGRRLFIQFRKGKVFSFSGVPKSLFTDLRTAPSKGGFFSTFIKNVYSYVEISGSSDVVFIDAGDGSADERARFEQKWILQSRPDSRWAW